MTDTNLEMVAVQALEPLCEAYERARELQTDVWEFAVELDALRSAGLSSSQLRCLIRKGYVEHAVETYSPGRRKRAFRPIRNLSFPPGTCVALTPAGFAYVKARESACSSQLAQGIGESEDSKPHWESERRVLSLGGVVVKHYRQAAPDQEAVLASFQE